MTNSTRLHARSLSDCNPTFLDIPPLKPEYYPLDATQHINDDIELGADTWPGGNAPDVNQDCIDEHRTDVHQTVARRLIDDVNIAIHWLNANQECAIHYKREYDQLQIQVIDLLDHYCNHFWLPILLERLTASHWQTIASSAAINRSSAHFLSLLITQLCYSANSDDLGRLLHAERQIRKAGISFEALLLDPKQPRHEAYRSKNPTIGYLLRFESNHQPGYWILGLAGTQMATLTQNLHAHCKPFISGGKHSGYLEYYQNLVRPSLQAVLAHQRKTNHQINVPNIIHVAGHSMGGALAHFAALDFTTLVTNTLGLSHPVKDLTLVIHTNNSARAGGVQLHQELQDTGVGCIVSSHIEDVVTTVPPNFLGYNRSSHEPDYHNSLHETAEKLKLLGKNWREGFIRHRLAVFLMLFAPEEIRSIFEETALHLPTTAHYNTLGYRYLDSERGCG